MVAKKKKTVKKAAKKAVKKAIKKTVKKVVKKAAAKKPVSKKTAKKTTKKASTNSSKIKVTMEQRHKMICEAAYYISKRLMKQSIRLTTGYRQRLSSIKYVLYTPNEPEVIFQPQ